MHEPALGFFLSLNERDRKACFGVLSDVVEQRAEELVGLFYEVFLKDEEASVFLSQSDVHNRLSGSLHKWLIDLVKIDPVDDLLKFKDRQRSIGAIHARIKIPVNLVLEGASLLKRDIAVMLMRNFNNVGEISAIILINELIDFAMLHMSEAYVKGTEERVQVDEAFRLFSLGQDVTLERETQKTTLMEWSQVVLFGILGGNSFPNIEPLAQSPFGLWVRHRAAVTFDGSIMLHSIERAIAEIDHDLLPAIRKKIEIASSVARLQVLIEEIKYLLNDLFQSLTASANARDPLTSALTRRFLPSILGREVSVSIQQSIPLSVLMIDADHFKKINDEWGHSAGDEVLRQLTDTITSQIRPSDYLFRYGGEEFLAVLVETDRREAIATADRIRSSFEGTELEISSGEKIRATVSIGVALHNGHPDYQRLIDAADHALYKAKSDGRNLTRAA